MNTQVRNILKGIATNKKRKLNIEDPFDSEKIVSASEISIRTNNLTFRIKSIFKNYIGKTLTRKKCLLLMRTYCLAELIQEDDDSLVFDCEGNPPVRTLQFCFENGILKDYFFCK